MFLSCLFSLCLHLPFFCLLLRLSFKLPFLFWFCLSDLFTLVFVFGVCLSSCLRVCLSFFAFPFVFVVTVTLPLPLPLPLDLSCTVLRPTFLVGPYGSSHSKRARKVATDKKAALSSLVVCDVFSSSCFLVIFVLPGFAVLSCSLSRLLSSCALLCCAVLYCVVVFSCLVFWLSCLVFCLLLSVLSRLVSSRLVMSHVASTRLASSRLISS